MAGRRASGDTIHIGNASAGQHIGRWLWNWELVEGVGGPQHYERLWH